MYVIKELHIHTLPEVNYERKKSLLYLELYTRNIYYLFKNKNKV